MKRKALKLLRVKHDLTQDQMSEKLGIARSTYHCIELGIRRGSVEFWEKLQQEFNIPNSEMYALQKMGEIEE